MAIIGALAKGLVKGSGRAVASNIMGRKKTVKPSAIAPRQGAQGQQQGQRKGSALVKSPTTAITKAMAPIQKVSTGPVAKGDYLAIIHEKVLTIEKIVTGVHKAEKDNLKAEKQAEKDDDRKNQEQKLETKDKKPEKKKPSLKQLPKLGVFGWLKRFIGNILMGLFLSKMVDFAGLLPKIVRTIDSVTTFLADFGILMVNALTTFADWGIKAYNFTFGAIEKVSGTLFGENADKVVGLIDTALFLTTAIAASMAVESLMGDDGGDFSSRKPGVNRGGTGVTQGRGGKGLRTRIPGTGPTVTQGRGGAPRGGFKFPKINLRGINAGSFVKGGATFGIGIGLDYLMNLGFSKLDAMQIQGVVNKFNSSNPEEKQKAIAYYDKLVKEYTKKTQGVGGAFDSFITLGGLLGPSSNQSLLRKFEATRAALISAQSEGGKVKQYQEGGRVRRKKVRRGIDIRKKKRKKISLARPTREVMAPLPTVDEKKLDPDDVGENNREWWDFLGWSGTGNAEKPLGQGGKILAEKTTKVGNELGKNDYFGPILRVASKLILDQDITSKDYSNIGRGINLLVDDGIVKNKVGTLGYNQGGLAENLPQLDVTDWVSKTFKDTLRDDLKKKYLPSSSYGSTAGPGATAGPDSAPGVRDSATGELQGGVAGGAVSPSELYKKIGANAEQWNIFRNSVALIESGGDYSIPGGSGMHYDGRYQMGEAAKKDGSKYAGVNYPGHSDDPDAQVRAAYRADKELQETIFTGFTLANHTYLMGNETYKNSTVERKLQILGYAHNQGMGGAEKWITTGVVGKDGFGTKGTKYTDLIAANFRAKKSGKDLELADNAIDVPSVSPTSNTTDISDTKQGKGTEASNRLLKDYPQIKSQNSPQQIYASGLGYFLKKSGAGRPGRGDFGDPPGGDMEHPDHGGVVASHRGSGHGRGVALDLGGNSATSGSYRDDQRKLWPYISRYLKKYGLNTDPFIPQILHGKGEIFSPVGPSSGADGGHNDHFHVEFHKGGIVGGSGLVNAVLKTGEMVIDVDSTGPAKNLLLAINQASSREGIIKAIRDYAPYDARAEQTIMVPEVSEDVPQVLPSGGSSSTTLLPILMGGSNPFEFLEYQG